jgi:hypothetical protein
VYTECHIIVYHMLQHSRRPHQKRWSFNRGGLLIGVKTYGIATFGTEPSGFHCTQVDMKQIHILSLPQLH